MLFISQKGTPGGQSVTGWRSLGCTNWVQIGTVWLWVCVSSAWLCDLLALGCPVLRPFIPHQIIFLIKRIKQSSGTGFIGLVVLCRFSLWCQCDLPGGVHRRMLQPQKPAASLHLPWSQFHQSESCPLAEMKSFLPLRQCLSHYLLPARVAPNLVF